MKKNKNHRQQVGGYFVEGNDEFAQVFEMRMGKKFILEEFNNKLTTHVLKLSAFDRALQWAQERQQ